MVRAARLNLDKARCADGLTLADAAAAISIFALDAERETRGGGWSLAMRC
jgi:hypothetical protein